MANYCSKCGAPLKAGQKFCANCGAVVGDEISENQDKTQILPNLPPQSPRAIRQQGQSYTSKMQMGYPSTNHDRSNKQNVIIGLLVGIIVLLIGGFGFYVYSSSHQETSQEQTEPAPPSSPSKAVEEQSTQMQSTTTTTASAPVGSDLRDFVQEKNAVDNEIANLASNINGYLSDHATFRGNSNYSDQAKGLQIRLQRDMQELKDTQAADEGKKQAILNLYQIEYRRVSGLYNGVMSSRQGGSYQPGFADGTNASYDFDAANADFKSKY